MLMYRCRNCGHVFDPMDAISYMEDYGERFSGCPVCLGDYEEIEVCDKCDTIMEFDEDALEWVCPECGEVLR